MLNVQSLLKLISYLFFISISFWSIQGLMFYKYMTIKNENRIKLLIILLSVVIGYVSSSFFLDLISSIKELFLNR